MVLAFAMSVFRLHMGLYNDIQKVIARFWWASKKDKNNIHLARWERMRYAKSRGDIEFRDFSSFNQVQIAKQGWRLLQFPESLVAKILKANTLNTLVFLVHPLYLTILFLEEYFVR